MRVCGSMFASSDRAMMITVTFCHDKKQFLMTMPKNIELRELQQDLCLFYQERFPKKMAKVNVFGKEYDSFMEQPFEDVIGDEIEVSVTFQDTDDTYFYDRNDRCSIKHTIEDEVNWEIEYESGTTGLTFHEWLRNLRSNIQ